MRTPRSRFWRTSIPLPSTWKRTSLISYATPRATSGSPDMVAVNVKHRVELNLNTFVWPVFEGRGRFTPPQHASPGQVLPGAGREQRLMMSWVFNVVPTTPDDDIRAGRLKKFSSMRDLIADLDKP